MTDTTDTIDTDAAPATPNRAARRRKAKTVDMSNHPLAHRIPAAWYADDYVGRKIGGQDDFDILDAAYEMKHNVLIEGPTGSSKTSLVYAWAAKRQLPLINIACNGAIDPRQLLGGWLPQPGKGSDLHFVRGDLYMAVEYGAVAYWDEVNMMPGRIGASAHGLFDKRRELTVMDAAGSEFPTSVVAHPNFMNVGAYNGGGYVDTFDLNEAFKNRHACKLIWDYDRNVESELVNSETLLDMAQDFRKRVKDGTLRTPIATNLLIEWEQWYRRFGLGFAVEMFTNAFHEDERPVVQEAVKAYIARIEDDLLAVDWDA